VLQLGGKLLQDQEPQERQRDDRLEEFFLSAWTRNARKELSQISIYYIYILVVYYTRYITISVVSEYF
jgi:hypothetical protein